jgi:carboxyl-terminal processing protease
MHMKSLLFLSIASIGLVSSAVAQAPAVQAPSATADANRTNYQKLFEALWQTVNENFFDPKMNGVDFVAVRERYRPLFVDVSTDTQFLELGNKMIRELGTSHLDVIPPEGFWQRGAGGPRGVISQRLRRIADELYYFAPAAGVAAEGLRPGDQILSAAAKLSGPLGASEIIRVRGCDGAERNVAVTYRAPQGSPAYQQKSIIAGPAGRRVAYAKIEGFNDDVIDFSDKLIAESRDTDGMILDVRNNSGGSITALYLANYFAEGSRPTVSLVGRKVLSKLGRMPTAQDLAAAPKSTGKYRFREVLPQLMKHGQLTFYSEGRGDKGYRKPVTVLVNSGTGSAAEGFAFMMKGLSSAKVIGRKTAGALVRGQEFKLPYGWEVTVPVYGLWGPNGESYIDQAVRPDIPVEWTRQDYCESRDPDIAAAMTAMFGSGK